MKIDLAGKTAFVTGGNIGIGGAISLALAEHGAQVALTYYSHQDAADTLVSEIRRTGGKALALQLDATDVRSVERAVREAVAAMGGKIDILVNNAGHLVGRVKIADMSDEHFRETIDVNLTSTFLCTRAVLPHMPDGGRIVNMASLAARNGGGPGAAAYAAAKAGVLGFTWGLAKELAPRGITVNALAPGFILDTPFQPRFTPGDQWPGIIAGIPLGRAGKPTDVTGAVLYFVSELGDWITGDVAEINGGAWFT